jgi:hypothetical protein
MNAQERELNLSFDPSSNRLRLLRGKEILIEEEGEDARVSFLHAEMGNLIPKEESVSLHSREILNNLLRIEGNLKE